MVVQSIAGARWFAESTVQSKNRNVAHLVSREARWDRQDLWKDGCYINLIQMQPSRSGNTFVLPQSKARAMRVSCNILVRVHTVTAFGFVAIRAAYSAHVQRHHKSTRYSHANVITWSWFAADHKTRFPWWQTCYLYTELNKCICSTSWYACLRFSAPV